MVKKERVLSDSCVEGDRLDWSLESRTTSRQMHRITTAATGPAAKLLEKVEADQVRCPCACFSHCALLSWGKVGNTTLEIEAIDKQVTRIPKLKQQLSIR